MFNLSKLFAAEPECSTASDAATPQPWTMQFLPGDCEYDAVFGALPRGSALAMEVIIHASIGHYEELFVAVAVVGGISHQIACCHWRDVLKVAWRLRDELDATIEACAAKLRKPSL